MSNLPLDQPKVSPNDCFNIQDRLKKAFTYRLHRHNVCELQFVQHAKGAKRIFGNSVETIGEYDLVITSSEELEHVWLQGDCSAPEFRQITIQFDLKWVRELLANKTLLAPAAKMLKDAEYGISFDLDAIMKVYDQLDALASIQDGFEQLLSVLWIFNELSKFKGRVLATSFIADDPATKECDRITTIKNYINDHYKDDLTLEILSDIAGMTPSSFSRYFKQVTGTSMTGYVTEVRIRTASRLLVDTKKKISEIYEECGFNNLSNFNRVFKDIIGLTPREYRTQFKKKTIIL